MQVLFETRDPQATELRELTVQRLQFSLRRLRTLVPRARVRLSDVNGPRGGVDKRCQIELSTDVAGTLVTTAMARDWRSAIDSAVARAARLLLRNWRRSRVPTRPAGRGRAPAPALAATP